MKRLAVLRPEPGASATVERARRLGLDAFAIPLFVVEGVEWQAPDATSFDALLLTSANAVRMGGTELNRLTTLPVHAVGATTASAAREAGFHVAGTGASGIDQLLGSLPPGMRLLHLCGEDRRAPDETRGSITPMVVYRSRPKEPVGLHLAADSVAMIHSPRAGQRFAALIDQAGIERGSIAIAAISEAAAGEIGHGWASVEFTDRPDDEALLALAERLCNKPEGQ
jgi:uroporphyrinogen-III synthase